MAGTLIERQLTTTANRSLHFAVATTADDAAIRRLLRDNPMQGKIILSFEREPNYFAGTGLAETKDETILAYADGSLACIGRCSTLRRYINNEVRRVGYLAELRLDASVQGRFDIVKGGYQFFREQQQANPADLYFTSIAADNHRAIRFLERGVSGMPTYQFLTEFVTLLIPVPRSPAQAGAQAESAKQQLQSSGLRFAQGSPENVAAIVACLNAQARTCQLATYWTEGQLLALAGHGLSLNCWQIVFEGREIVACAARWDQRTFRQTVIRGYSPGLAFMRPIANMASKLLGTPHLPPPESVLAHAFLSPLSTAVGHESLLPYLIAQLLPTAVDAQLDFLTVGFAGDDPRLSVLRKHYRCHEYLSRLYRVCWPDLGSAVDSLGANIALPEVALL